MMVARIATVASHPLGVSSRDVIPRRTNAAVERCTKGIEPGVDLQAASMRLADGNCQWIVSRVCTLTTSELRGPGRERRLIECVTAQPNVKDDGVEAKSTSTIQQRDELALLLLGGKAGARRPVAIRRGAQPRAAELAENDRRKDSAIAQSDARHVARSSLWDDALGPRATGAADE